MTVTYLSPKLMEELKDRAIRVTVDPGGTLVWLKDAGEWFWLQPWQKPFVEKALRGEPLKLNVPRVSAPIQPMYDLTAANRERRPIAETLAEPPEVRAERLEQERLVVLGRLFERLFRGGGLVLAPTTGQVVWWICPAQSYDEMLSAEELEAVRGIR